MVDVTGDNFLDLLPEIEEDLNSCLFVAIDAEFTGLLTDKLYSNE